MCWNKDDQLVIFTSVSTFHIITIDGTEYLRQDLPEVRKKKSKKKNLIENQRNLKNKISLKLKFGVQVLYSLLKNYKLG